MNKDGLRAYIRPPCELPVAVRAVMECALFRLIRIAAFRGLLPFQGLKELVRPCRHQQISPCAVASRIALRFVRPLFDNRCCGLIRPR